MFCYNKHMAASSKKEVYTGTIQNRVLTRTVLKKVKHPSFLMLIAVVCWGYIVVSFMLAHFAPGVIQAIYGDGLQAYVSWGMSLAFAGIIGTILTVIELFGASKARP